MSPVRPTSTSSPRLPPDSAVGGPVREVLSLDQLVTDAGTQVRSAIDDEVVDEYVQALADGAQFPPVVVFRADGAEMLADGYHRVFAYRKAGRSEIPADVYHGTREDALWFALGANRAHGQRLSGADKRRAIELAYRAWPDLSQVRIAAQVGCAQPYVGEVRAQLKATFKLPDRVVGVDGRLRAATRPASSSRRKPSPCSDAAADSPAPIAGDGGSRLDVDSLPSAGRPVASAVGDPSLVPSSELPVSQPPVPDDDLSELSSSSGSSPAPSGNGLTASQSARDRSNRIVSVVAYDAKNLTAQEDLIEFAALDRAQSRIGLPTSRRLAAVSAASYVGFGRRSEMDPRPRRSKIEKVGLDSLRVPPAGKAQRPFRQAKGDEIAGNFDIDRQFRLSCRLPRRRRQLAGRRQ